MPKLLLLAAATWSSLAWSPVAAAGDHKIDDLSFLKGAWKGGDGDFVFEEIWSAPEGGVMTGMARGVGDGTLRVLEYIVVAEENGGLVMRFKHFNADYSTWEDGAAPLELTLTALDGTDATFTADPPSHTVTSIRYWMPEAATLRVDVEQIENGETGGFSLTFAKVD
ncbi:MAG: DUF6265 family protein [Pseudomonadota bacterium]